MSPTKRAGSEQANGGPRIVLLGKQGAGKGTQASRLAAHYGVVHLATGDAFRAAVHSGTAYGAKAQSYIDSGALVPDDVVIGLIEERFAQDQRLAAGFILDGCPRTRPQALALDDILLPARLSAVVALDVPTDVVLHRLSGRRVCVDCGTNYHVDLPPLAQWKCDKCGADVEQRSDDTEEAILRRLELYEIETAPLIEFYSARGLLEVVSGIGEGDEVFRRSVSAIDARSRSDA